MANWARNPLGDQCMSRHTKRRACAGLLALVVAAVIHPALSADRLLPAPASAPAYTIAPWLAALPPEPDGYAGPRPTIGRDPSDPALKPSTSPVALRGYVQTELARTYAGHDHWSKMLLRTELSATGRINEHIRWKLSGRLDYDAVYDIYDFYPPNVREDQRLNFEARENFLEIATGVMDLRLGRQHVVWGEIVGFFVADVVSAKDMRQFLLADFDVLRIPQWAARAEYLSDRFNAELLWIPLPSYDEFGKPGAEFFPPTPPVPTGFATAFAGETRPARTLSNSNYGARISTLREGWDVSAFYYRSMDSAPTFYRQISFTAPQPTIVFEARHDRIAQFGSTLAKDFGSVVLKAEAVYTSGRQFNVTRAADDDGVVPQNTVDWVTGADFTLPTDSRLNVQLFQRIFFDHDPDTFSKRRETGYSLYLTHELTDKVEAQVLWISSLDRTDSLLRPRVVWNFEQNWRLTAGVDVFNGSAQGFFGRFANRDRAYADLRYTF